MNFDLLTENLTNPALLFFFLGIIAVQLKSDLEIPAQSSKFISLYLLFSIGFKGGQELSHSGLSLDILWALLFGIALALTVPIYAFFLLKRKVGADNAAAIGAAYGSVSAVTFVTAVTFLELQQIPFDGHMVAVMAMMEAPSIIIGMLLYNYFDKEHEHTVGIGKIVKHAMTNGSVMLIMGSVVIGFIANEHHAEGIKPFTTDIFKGFLAIFLLDMGISSGKNLGSLFKHGKTVIFFSILVPLFNGCLVAFISQGITDHVGNRFMFAVLAASASYIAVPAAMRLAIPSASPGLYIPMSLALTFPFNITLGLPTYLYIVHHF